MEERIETLSRPGAKETEERHPRLGAVRAARAATDLARDDQRTNGAFGQVVVGRHAHLGDTGQQFVLEMPDAPGQRPTGMIQLVEELRAQRLEVEQQPLVEEVALL